MLEYATDVALPTKLMLVYGSHSPEEIAFRDDIETLAQVNPHVAIVHTVTITSPNCRGRIGRIDAALLLEAADGQPDAPYS